MTFTQAFFAFLASANAAMFGRMAYRGIKALLAGVTRKEADVLTSALRQRDEALERAEVAEQERDIYQRQVARRDYVILRNGLEIPQDGNDTIARKIRK